MTLKIINLGSTENDGTGDNLRDAFKKVNDNFGELFTRPQESTTAVNLGDLGASVYRSLSGTELQFRRVQVTGRLTIDETDTSIIISSDPGLNSLTIATTDNELLTLNQESEILGVFGNGPINTKIENGALVIDYLGPLQLLDEPAPGLGGTLFGNNNNIVDINLLSASEITGDLRGLVNGIDITDLDNFVRTGFDFGEITPTITGIIEWIISETVVDFGTFSAPISKNVDFGSFNP
jgi:hypothetical protein